MARRNSMRFAYLMRRASKPAEGSACSRQPSGRATSAPRGATATPPAGGRAAAAPYADWPGARPPSAARR